MEQKFVSAWQECREEAARLGIRLRPVPPESALETAHRVLSGRRPSDGFGALAQANRLDLTLEALASSKAYTALFTDQEVNQALSRLLEAGYTFQ